MRKAIMPALALLAASAAPAMAWEVTVYNCSADSLVVRSYDQGDVVRAIPYATITVGGKGSGKIGCVGASYCQLDVSFGNLMLVLPTAGYTVYVRKLDTSTGSTIDLPSNC